MNKPPWRCVGIRCVARFEVLVAEDTCKEGAPWFAKDTS
jgi:hypothetical protein